MKVAFAEQTIDFELGLHTVRVWRQIDHTDGIAFAQLGDLLSDTMRIDSMDDVRECACDLLLGDVRNVHAFLNRVTKMPGVTAVQVIRKGSNDGIVIYTEWP